MKRILACVLLLALISSCTVAFAAVQPRASELIVDRFIYAYAMAMARVQFSVDMTTLTVVDKLGFPSIKLQEKQGSSWVTVKVGDRQVRLQQSQLRLLHLLQRHDRQ